MRSVFLQSLTSAALLALAGCVAPSEPAPEAAPPVPMPTRAPPPPPAPRPTPSADWRDWALSPGTWTYRREGSGSVAGFGAAGAAPALSLRCDAGAGRITLSLGRVGAGSATVRTSSSVRALPLTRGADGQSSASLGARDGLLDAMGFSRGRFIVEVAGQPPLVVPAWPEILRVAEDCRR
ncbi:hypothetical protein LQ953_11215 [Sphingomonas sp. IC-56]|uniref:hypothetical protein n=1 Tax=Sphingomonas sp. IC-56 TaxID=2898529 RepID=UPI001E415467|nr:hypothetical protein [Sphingomonas sp. IC-56]MCD2324582.1 hypothetical protein [Sphingomonas sp. IC-56]